MAMLLLLLMLMMLLMMLLLMMISGGLAETETKKRKKEETGTTNRPEIIKVIRQAQNQRTVRWTVFFVLDLPVVTACTVQYPTVCTVL